MTATDRPLDRDARRGNRRLALALVGLVGGMAGLAYASVPLYQLFCRVTGYGGTPAIATGAGAPHTAAPGARTITVRFDANVAPDLPWSFRPERLEMRLPLGEEALAHYVARNTSDRAVSGTATFNVSPQKAASYFTKIDCFCFTEQRLEAGREQYMPVSFYVDPAIDDDPNARDVGTITLSYTFFRDPKAERAEPVPAGGERARRRIP